MTYAEAIDPVDPLFGHVVDGRYQLHEMIGRGGVGVVYLATELSTGRTVVVKFLADSLLSNPRAVARFEREARRLGEVRHPNIVAMLGHGRDHGRGYLVMEFAEGELLDDYIARRGRLSVHEFVPIAAQILKGMAHAHAQDLMIRDIKPSNVILCQRGDRDHFVKILDFGLAKHLRDEFEITHDHVVGTVGYVAPEALRGQPADLRVDVYAAGMLFYRMLCGRLPFDGYTNATVFFKTVHETVPDLTEYLPTRHGIPRPVLDLVLSCVQKDPDARPSDAGALVARLIDCVPPNFFRLPAVEEGSTSRHRLLASETETVDRSVRRRPRGGRTAGAVALGGMFTALACAAALTTIGDAPWRTHDEGSVARGAPATTPESTTGSAPIPGVTPPAPTAAVVPATPPPAPTLGEVKLDARPAAYLWVDGEPAGMTPFDGELAVGTHVVRFARAGYRSWATEIEVTERRPERVSVTLVRHPKSKRRKR